MNNRLDELEARFAFQEDLIQKLDQALADQQTQLLQLQLKMKLLIEQVKNVDQGLEHDFYQQNSRQEGEEPPPHY